MNPRWAPGDPPSRGGATASPSRQHETPSPACGSPAPRQRHLGAPGAAGGGENASGGGSVWGSGAAGISHCRARSGPQTCKCLLSPEVCGAFVCQVSGASPPPPTPARPPALRSQPGAAGRCCESWLNFPFSSGMWGKGMQDALELLDPIGTYLDREPLNSAGLRVKALPSSLPSVFLPLPPSFLILLLD